MTPKTKHPDYGLPPMFRALLDDLAPGHFEEIAAGIDAEPLAFVPGSPAVLATCGRCGALVADKDAHRDWHGRINVAHAVTMRVAFELARSIAQVASVVVDSVGLDPGATVPGETTEGPGELVTPAGATTTAKDPEPSA